MASVISANENIVSFRTSEALPFSGARIEFGPVQAGSGDPSPDNVRAISGWNGLDVHRDGKNLLRWWKTGYYSSTRNTWYPSNNNAAFQPIKANASDTFYFSVDGPVASGSIYFFDFSVSQETSNDTYISGTSISNSYTGRYTKKITPPQDCWMILQIDYQSSQTEETCFDKRPQIELGESATDYEVSSGSVSSITFPSTIYGGWCDPFTGTGEITHVSVTNSTTANRYENENGYFWYSTREELGVPYIESTNADLIMDRFVLNGNLGVSSNEGGLTFYGNGIIRWKEQGELSVSEYKEYLAEHPFQLSYKLKDPIPFTFTPATLSTLVGVNNFWSNANGSINEVAYRNSSTNIETYRDRIMNTPHVEEAAGNIASFQTDMVAPLEEIKIHFNPQQASGTPSPSSSIPIYGWTECDLWRTDVNLYDFPVTDFNPDYNVNGWTGWGDYYYIPQSWRGQTFTYSATITVKSTSPREYCQVRLWQYNSDNQPTLNNGNGIYRDSTDKTALSKVTVTIKEDTVKLGIGLYIGAGDRVQNPMFEPGSTASSYEPYVGNQIPVSWSSLGTVYGGWINPVNGEVWADTLMVEANSSNTSVRSNIQSYYGRFLRTALPYNGDNSRQSEIKGNIATFTGYPAVTRAGANVAFASVNVLYWTTDECATEQGAQSMITAGAVFTYPLATPRLVGTISPIQFKTLYNQNNIWSSGNGDTEVKFWTHGEVIPDRRKVVWNQGYKPLNADNWVPQNSSYSTVTFENGEALRTIIQDVSQVYQSSIINQTDYYNEYAGHKYLLSQDIKPSNTTDYVNILGADWKGDTECQANQWTTLRGIYTMNTDRSKTRLYLGYGKLKNGQTEGTYCRIRNPLLIDLTQMYGSGNEPATVAEFEAQCAKNGIDLTQPQPYNAGTERWWYT